MSTSSTGITGRQLIRATMEFDDCLASMRDSTGERLPLQGLVSCKGIIPLLLWAKTLYENSSRTWRDAHREELRRFFETVRYNLSSTVVSIVVLGPSSENEQRHLLKLFLEKGFTKNRDRFAGYHHFFDSDGSPGKLIRFTVQFQDNPSLQHAATRLRLRRSSEAEGGLYILTADIPQIVLEAVRNLYNERSHTHEWETLELHQKLVQALQNQNPELSKPFSLKTLVDDWDTLIKRNGPSNESQDLRAFLQDVSRAGGSDDGAGPEENQKRVEICRWLAQCFLDEHFTVPGAAPSFGPPFPRFPETGHHVQARGSLGQS